VKSKALDRTGNAEEKCALAGLESQASGSAWVLRSRVAIRGSRRARHKSWHRTFLTDFVSVFRPDKTKYAIDSHSLSQKLERPLRSTIPMRYITQTETFVYLGGDLPQSQNDTTHD
jgi:hypothetical protein